MDNHPKKIRVPNPTLNASLLSLTTYFYTFPLFLKGYRRNLEESDLFDIVSDSEAFEFANKVEFKWKKEVLRAKELGKQPCLKKFLFRLFFWQNFLLSLLAAMSEIVWITIPVLFGYYLNYFDTGEMNISEIKAYGCAIGIILCQILNAVFGHYFLLKGFVLGMNLRTVCSSLIYRKLLKLNRKSLSQTSTGHIINLLSNDMDKLDRVTFAHYIWMGPIDCILATYIMYREVQESAFIGISVMLIIMPIQILICYVTKIYRGKCAEKCDKRIKITNEILSGIQVIKMYVWEKLFTDVISKIRRSEIRSISLKAYSRSILESLHMFTTRIAVFFTVIAYVLLGGTLTARKAFVVYMCYSIIKSSTTWYFSEALVILAESNITLKRITSFLLLDELPNKVAGDTLNTTLNQEIEYSETMKQRHVKSFVRLKAVSAKWIETSDAETLKNINLEVDTLKLVGIVGSIGSGKTSLLQIVCNELIPSSGKVEINGKISYSSQEPWLFAGTVRDNILFGQPMNTIKYQHIIKVCCLQRDLDLMPYADLTYLGDRGVSVSGGQRARISLARAVYRDADIYLLDDPFSSIDTNVSRHIFENCICGYLKNRIVILTTHQIYLLKGVEQVVYLEDGQIKAQGSYGYLINSYPELTTIAGNNRGETEESEKEEDSLNINMYVNNVSNIRDGQNTKRVQGSVASQVYLGYIKSAGSYCLPFCIIILFTLAQCIACGTDFLLAFWTDGKQNDSIEAMSKYIYDSPVQDDYYVNQEGLKLNLLNDNVEHNENTESTEEYAFIILYSTLIIALIIVCLVRSTAFHYFCIRASIKLHDNMFSSVIRATMKFFSDTRSGDILNKFSSDMGVVDEVIPARMMNVLQVGFITLSILAVVVFIDLWFIIPTVVMVTLSVLCSMVYLRISREVKRLERQSRSLVFGHANATLQGLTTIRALGAENILAKEFDNYLNLHNSGWYTSLVTSRAYSFWLDILCVFFNASIVLKFLLLQNGASIGIIGLAVVQGISLSRMFQGGVRESTELENHFISVERILECNSIESESKNESSLDQKPPPDWPQNGKIEFKNLSLRYSKDDPLVLQDLNFVIYPRERIGIVGRTGAGKSSLITAIFQLAKTDGKILIDDIDISEIGDLRKKISIIPQQPMLFTGTLRHNLDPFGEFPDEEIWQVLRDVELNLCPLISKDGLGCQIEEGGANFSIGQKQLICLARAILCKNKILILDEATANVDHHTDIFVQKTIRDKFKDCTVLTIAHRLDTVMDSDRILVIEAGKIVEFDSPNVLLRKKGYFYKMMQKTDVILMNHTTK